MDKLTIDLVNRIISRMPEGVEFVTNVPEVDAVRFEWRGTTYRVDERLHVEEVEDGTLAGSDRAALVQQLLRPDFH